MYALCIYANWQNSHPGIRENDCALRLYMGIELYHMVQRWFGLNVFWQGQTEKSNLSNRQKTILELIKLYHMVLQRFGHNVCFVERTVICQQ